MNVVVAATETLLPSTSPPLPSEPNKKLSPCSPKIKLAIVGYRKFFDYKKFSLVVDQWITENGTPSKIISGGCNGTDTMAARYAKQHNIKIKEFIPKVKKPATYGKACMERDREIAIACTHMIAFPNPDKGKGTQLTMTFAKRESKPIKVVNV